MKRNTKTTSIFIAILCVALALFVGLWVGNITKGESTSNDDYVPPSIIDETDVVIDPDYGTVDKDAIEEEIYTIKPNSLITKNAQYLLNENATTDDKQELAEQLFYYDSILGGMAYGDVGEASFITVARLGHENLESSKLVYIKFSTFVGKYTNAGELEQTLSACVVFGYELTPENTTTLKYSFATYGDRGPVTTQHQTIVGNTNALTVRVPYLLADDYAQTIKLFDKEGLTIDDYTYKILTQDGTQISINGSALVTITNLMKSVLNHNLSTNQNSSVLTNYNLSSIFTIEGVTEGVILSEVTFEKDCFILANDAIEQEYFANSKYYSAEISSVWGNFNNANAFYNIPLVSVEI